jgi:hypothetical protein
MSLSYSCQKGHAWWGDWTYGTLFNMYWSTAGVRVDLDPTEVSSTGDMILYTSLSDMNELTTL